MITLDEVIKNFEICRKARGNIRGCDGCTYADDADAACIMHNESDVLYYLNEYRDSKATIADAMEWHTQAVLRHMDEANKLAVQRFVMEYDNPPLTWQELKGMEGKPVWVVPEEEKGYWFVIEFFNNNPYYGGDRVCFTNDVMLNRCDLGKTWQAFRKERE